MITEDEKRWLGLRKNLCARCEFNLYDNPCIQYGKRGTSGECPGFYSTLCAEYNFVDAAEFEARVAVLLTDRDAPYVPPCHIVCNHRRKCRACRLMYARIAVEAEMDK